MKNKNINRGTVKKVLALTHRIVPGYIIFLLTTKMMAAAQPFIGIYCSSLILDGLIHLDRFESIFKTVLIMIALDSLLVLIRWIILAINHGYTPYESPWAQVDQMLTRFSYKIAGTFLKGNMSYQKSLLVTWIVLLVFWIAGTILIGILKMLCARIPF